MDILRNIKLAGTFYNITSLEFTSLEVGSRVCVAHEPTNKFDSDAVSLGHNGVKLGYLPKAFNEYPAELLRQGNHLYGEIVALDKETLAVYVNIYKRT